MHLNDVHGRKADSPTGLAAILLTNAIGNVFHPDMDTSLPGAGGRTLDCNSPWLTIAATRLEGRASCGSGRRVPGRACRFGNSIAAQPATLPGLASRSGTCLLIGSIRQHSTYGSGPSARGI